MTTSVLVEEEAWENVPAVEPLVIRAVNAAFVGKQYRKKDKATNVLSFPASLMPVPPGEMAHLGDIVLAYETIVAEARTANKSLADHVTHLVVHGTLHLLGHDHEVEGEAEAMEAKEREILAGLGLADPYQV
jgi:probable rRNA maturation factor